MHVLRMIVLLFLFFPLNLPAAERYPVKPDRIVVTFPLSLDVQERLLTLGSEPASSTAEQMQKRLHDDMTKYSQLIKTAGVQLD